MTREAPLENAGTQDGYGEGYQSEARLCLERGSPLTLTIFYYDLLLLFGAVVAYEDWKDRKIRNRWILVGLGCCAMGYLYLFVNSLANAGRLLG